MLRASVEQTGQTIELRAVVDTVTDPGIPAGCELRALTDAAVLRDDYERDVALVDLVQAAGEPAALRAAATIGNFEMMNRLLDGTGVGPPDRFTAIATDLGFTWPVA